MSKESTIYVFVYVIYNIKMLKISRLHDSEDFIFFTGIFFSLYGLIK
jgi:hypothetical protein